MLTNTQLLTLKADIAADGALSVVGMTSDGDYLIAAAYNSTAIPDFWVWRPDMSVQEMVNGNPAGPGVDWSEYQVLSTQFQSAFLALTQSPVIDATQANIRSAFGAIFTTAGSPNSRANLIAIARRKATRAEKLFAVGTGSTASPAIMAFIGALNLDDVRRARAS